MKNRISFCVNACKKSTFRFIGGLQNVLRFLKYANSWDFFELNFSPTIYPPIICLKWLFSATYQKKEIPDNA